MSLTLKSFRRLLGATIALCAVQAHSQQLIYCIHATSTLCNPTTQVGTGTQGDPAWMIFGKIDVDLQNPISLSVPSFLTVTGSPFNVGAGGALAVTYSGVPLPVANGGTGSASPGLTAGSNISITGAWPNQTISGSGTVGAAFSAVTTGVNTTALQMGTGGTLSPTGSGTITANALTNGIALQTPASGVATNLTGLPLATGVAGILPVINGGNGTGTPGIIAGTNITVTGSWPAQTVNATGSGSSAFNSITSGTNTSAAMVVGTGSSLAPSGSGSVTANTLSSGIALGTPGSGTLSNEIGLPLTTGVVGLLPVVNGGTGTASPALVAGTNVTISGAWPNQTITSSSTASTAFSALTGSTNTSAAMVVGTGASLGATGSGTIAATSVSGPTVATTLSASSTVSGAGFSAYLASPPAIGGTAPASGAFSTATATSLNGDVFTAGSYTLTGTAAKTLTFTNSLTLSGTDATTMTFPAASGTVDTLNATQTFTAPKTFTNSDLLLLGSSTGATTLASANASATNYTLTFPAATDTMATLAATQTLTNKSIAASEINSGTLAVANGGTGTASPGIVAGTNVTVSGTWPNQTVNATGSGSSAFNSLTSGTNTTAAMVVGTGGSLAATGTGTIAATSLGALTGMPSQANQTVIGNGSGGAAVPIALTLTGNLVATATTLGTSQTINPQTGTTYALLTGDAGKLLTFSNAGAVAVSVSQATTTGFTAGYSFDVENLGAGTVTITPATSTINGASTLTIATNRGCTVTSDGTNYQASACTALVSGGGTVTTASVATANGFSGTVANATTTPAITINTSFTGVPYSTSGSGMAAATAAQIAAVFCTTSTTLFLRADGTCVAPSGSGTITSSTTGQVPVFTAATTVGGSANATLTAGALTLGVSGTAGSITMGNATSGTVAIAPVTGALGAVTASLPANTGTIAELNLAETWTGVQTYTNSDLKLLGSSTGANTFTAANASATNYTTTVPAATGTIAEINLAETFTAAQTFTNSDLLLLGSSTGATTFTSANASATAYTVTVPAATDTLAELTQTQTLTNKTISGASNTLSAIPLTALATQAANTVVMNATGSAAAPTAVTTVSYLIDAGTIFTLGTGTGTCATTTTLTGGTAVGSFKCTGTGGASTQPVTLPLTTNGWVCDFHDMTTTADALIESASSTTSATMSGTLAANDVVYFKCAGF